MGDIKYSSDGMDDYSSPPVLAFRGPPYGVVTDFIIARGWARTRRQAEIRLVYISLACIAIVFAIFAFGGENPDPIQAMTPAEAEQYLKQ